MKGFRKYLAEFIGTGVLVFVACGVAGQVCDVGGAEGSILISLAIEIALTFVFVLAILGVTSKEGNGAVAGLVIGGALVLVHLLGIPFTGTSVNPARTFGPALFNGSLSIYWIFLVGPLAGGALAAVVYKFLTKED